MEIVFLGTGGGRFNLIGQVRRTAGFRINGPLSFHVDPGPGVLSACRQFGQQPQETDVIVVTHNHIDHVNDAGLLCEALFNCSFRKKGWLIGSKSALKGDENGDRGVSWYHQQKMEKALVAHPGRKIEIRMSGKKAALLPTAVRHDDATGFGFVLEMGGQRIGYTSDTEYFEGAGRQYAGCGLLIVNNLKSGYDGVKGHLYSATTAKLLAEAKPKLAVMTHLGMKLILAGPGKEAARIARLSGVRTVASEDGMKIDAGTLRFSRAAARAIRCGEQRCRIKGRTRTL